MTTITSQVWLMTLMYALGWGAYLVLAARDYYRLVRARARIRKDDMAADERQKAEDRRRRDLVAAVRHLVIAICIFMFPFSFFVRSSLVLAGLAEQQAGQLTFFALAGVNALGCIIAITTRVRPGWFS